MYARKQRLLLCVLCGGALHVGPLLRAVSQSFLKVWWHYATLFEIYYFFNIHTIQSHTVHPSPFAEARLLESSSHRIVSQSYHASMTPAHLWLGGEGGCVTIIACTMPLVSSKER